MEKLTAKHFCIGIMLIAFLLRLPEFLITLAYDEIWTLTNFTRLPWYELLFDLTLPNNHPLNSITVKFMTLFDFSQEYIRLPNLFAGLGSVVLAGLLGKRLAGKSGMLWSMFFMAVNAPLIVYSCQARGYGLQVFWLLLFAYSVIRSAEKVRKQIFTIFDALIIVSSLLAVITLSTSALYLTGIVFILWNHAKWQLPCRSTVCSIIIAGVLSLVYLVLNYHDLQAARVWGTAINSASGYCNWLCGVLYEIIPAGTVGLTICYFALKRRQCVGYLLLFLLLACSAIFTNGGPGRVYLPMCALLAVTAGAGAGLLLEKLPKLQHKQLLAFAFILLAAATNFYQMRQWSFTDYYPVLNTLDKVPESVLTVFPAGDGYPVLYNSNGKAAEKYYNTLEARSSLTGLLLLNSPGKINGMDKDFNEKSLPLPIQVPTETFANVSSQIYSLHRLQSVPESNEAIILIYRSKNETGFKELSKLLYKSSSDCSHILILNNWFNSYTPPGRAKVYNGVWYIAPGALESNAWNELAERFSGSVMLYRVEGSPAR